jgi:hypothetical protein
MIEEAERRGVFDLRAIEELCERSQGRRGLRPLVACLGATHAEPPHTKSDLEQMFLDLCRDWDLPTPTMNAYVEGYEVDAHWPGTDLVVELDSWAFHRTRGSFARDHERDLRLELAGYRVLRVTYWQLIEAEEVTRALRARLGSARTPPARDRGALARA